MCGLIVDELVKTKFVSEGMLSDRDKIQLTSSAPIRLSKSREVDEQVDTTYAPRALAICGALSKYISQTNFEITFT